MARRVGCDRSLHEIDDAPRAETGRYLYVNRAIRFDFGKSQNPESLTVCPKTRLALEQPLNLFRASLGAVILVTGQVVELHRSILLWRRRISGPSQSMLEKAP